MDSGLAAVLGGALGASATLGVSIINGRNQRRREVTSWRREQRETAYDIATLALLRIRNRRRRMIATQRATVSPEELPTYVDDLVDAQHGLWMLLVACGRDQRQTVRIAVEEFDELVDEMLANPAPGDLVGTYRRVDEVWDTVHAAQAQDVGA